MSKKGLTEIRHSANETGLPVSIRGVGVVNGEGVEQARCCDAIFQSARRSTSNLPIPSTKEILDWY